jgi:SpoVK/Ycf46/Vps4 family AAA+-type ATPase
VAVTATATPPGVLSVHALPADHHDGPWDAIITPPGLKDRLLGTTLLTMLHGRALSAMAGTVHGLIVLAGPTGTGKTTLARGLAQAAALAVAGKGATTFVEIDPHAFPSEMLGESQRNVTRLFRDTLPELAARRPHMVVLLDEVESFAVRRSVASLETNPVDVHRATDAVLAGIDDVAATYPGVVFVVTTNYVSVVDEAFLSRADLVLELALPDESTRAAILASALGELARHWPALRALADDAGLHATLAGRCAGWDGRRLRKLPLQAIATSPRTARDPATLTAADLLAAAPDQARTNGSVPVAPG